MDLAGTLVGCERLHHRGLSAAGEPRELPALHVPMAVPCRRAFKLLELGAQERHARLDHAEVLPASLKALQG